MDRTSTGTPPQGRHGAVWRPVVRPRAHELVLAQVLDRLRAGTLRRGDRLPGERDLAESMAVGRGAVREALRILEALGIGEANVGSSPTAAGTRVVDSLEGGLDAVTVFHTALGSFSGDEAREVLDQLSGIPDNRLGDALRSVLGRAVGQSVGALEPTGPAAPDDERREARRAG